MNKQSNAADQALKAGSGTTRSNAIEVPSISLPTGGGAIKGIDEKFSVNAVNGTASCSIPLPFSSARGMSPALSLSYSSGAGNGIFGMGWDLGLTSVKRKTDQGLPQYLDGTDSDTFLFSGADDLVPAFRKLADGSFEQDAGKEYVIDETDSPDNLFRIRLYKPRIEGLFARIERWWAKDGAELKWKIITRDNKVMLLGWTTSARIANPQDPTRIFEWLPEFVFDDKGNCTHYIYQQEDATHLDTSLLHNRNRIREGNINHTNTYLSAVRYGNKTPYKQFGDLFPAQDDYLFATVFDYGAYNPIAPYDKIKDWDFRPDAFSDYKPGFEIRTTRLCKRVLLYHHFKGADEYDGLVKSVNFDYETSEDNDLTFLKAVHAIGYIRQGDTYTQQQYPPLEFTYQAHDWNQDIKSVAAADLVHAPTGLSEARYQFTDLYNEGLSGILTKQANGWYYKHNLGAGHFGPAKRISAQPSFAGLGTTMQLSDLDADGGKQLVSFSNAPSGYFELDKEEAWQPFRAFRSLPNIDFEDANMRLLDLDGDGRPELLLSEDHAFTWYPSEGRTGFATARSTPKGSDEEAGPHILFADQQQSIFLADMSGDGLTDIVRIRNGEVCYWPNLGYGRFGAKVAVDNAPFFDHADAFNPSWIRLADIDGSGTTDIIYLGHNKFSCWKNRSGNSFNPIPFEISSFPDIHTQTRITTADLLGNGVACIVWSSPLAKDAHAPLKYIDLMNGRKPHIMVSYKNNMGKEVSLEYTPSTRYYLDDQQAGRPWATRLHFPVHCISKTITEDKISGSRFVSQYRYHHGYYDHAEREFRGFGMVEQTDSETFEDWQQDTAGNIVAAALYQEPVITKSWHHTGAFRQKDNILRQFESDYWYAEMERHNFPVTHHEARLPDARLVVAPGMDHTLLDSLSAQEWQEALRACKGTALRSEVFARDAGRNGNTTEAVQRELTPFTVATHNGIIELLQPKGRNKHAVFTVKESESITYNYERAPEDPRVVHNLNIHIDEYGNVLESATVVYPRKIVDASLPAETSREQSKTVITYTRNRFTNDVINAQAYRLRLPSEVQTFELKGVAKAATYYTPADFEDILSDTRSDSALYHETDKPLNIGKAQRRRIEHGKFIYYNNNLQDALGLHQLHSLAIPFESYQLAYTPGLISDIFGARVDIAAPGLAHFVALPGDAGWWLPSGRRQFLQGAESAPDAQERFYTPLSYQNPTGAITRTAYYGNHFLLVAETEDGLGNKLRVDKFNFRTLSPQSMRDINGNLSEAISNELGLVKAVALKGKGNQADALTGLTEATDAAEAAALQDFLAAPDATALTSKAMQLLQQATVRFIYDLEAYRHHNKPVMVASVSRETHVHAADGQPNPESKLRFAFEYASGLGTVVMKKVQATPGKAKQVTVNPDNSIVITEVDTATSKQLRWTGNGRVVTNNKGNVVKQYEPYFSVTHQYEDDKELVETGVTPLFYYDAAGRLIRHEMPDGTFSAVTFGSWKQAAYDTNDTVLQTKWYNDRSNRLIDTRLSNEGKDPAREQQTADSAARHADTPAVLHFDTMGRPVLSVEHNKETGTGADLFYHTMLQQDIAGNLQQIRDARDNVVMRYKYDMLGNKVYQQSMDAGERWLLVNCCGNPVRTWNDRGHELQHTYDILQRPLQSRVLGMDGAVTLDHIFSRTVYGESLLLADRSNETSVQQSNVLGRAIQHYDTAGLIDMPVYDFKGQPLTVSRRLFRKYKELANWTDAHLTADLEADIFTTTTFTDALGRIVQQVTPDKSIIRSVYNETGLLHSEHVQHFNRDTNSYAAPLAYIKGIDYNEKQQRTRIIYGNDVFTRFHYDRETFRLNRLESRRKNNELLQDLHYTYDPAGNITYVHDQAIATVFYNNMRIEPASGYTYDALYRLIRATGREQSGIADFGKCDNWNDKAFLQDLRPGAPMGSRNYTQEYQYDSVGNIARMRHIADGGNWTRRYEYETGNNRLKGTEIGDNGNPASYTNYKHHDKHGCLEQLPHLEQLAWNFKEELVIAARQHCTDDNNTPEITYYQYDGQGQRIRKITEGQATGNATAVKKHERIYIGGYELYKKHSGLHAGLERESLALADQGQRLAIIETRYQVDDGTPRQLTRYQLHDHLGSASLELNEAAAVISYEAYHPFGTTAYQARNADINAAAKRYRYTGMERDEETGLAYHSARYYIPWLGRWLSPDPIGIDGGLNLYEYCRGRPIVLSDPSGKSPYDEDPGQVLDLKKAISFPTDRMCGDARPGLLGALEQTIVSIGTAIGNTISAAARWVGAALSAAWEWTRRVVSSAWERAKNALATAWEWAKRTIPAAWDRVKNIFSAAAQYIRRTAVAFSNWVSGVARRFWNWFAGDDGFLEDALEVIGHLTWGLIGTAVGMAVSLFNLTIGNLVVAIHNAATNNQSNWEYASISIGGPANEDDIIGNYGGLWNLAGTGNAITFGPFVFFGGSRSDAVAGGGTSIQDYYANHDRPIPGHPYGAVTGLRTADHEEGHEDQNLMYGPFTLLFGLIFSLAPNALGANGRTSPMYWYDRQANQLSGRNSITNPNTQVHP